MYFYHLCTCRMCILISLDRTDFAGGFPRQVPDYRRTEKVPRAENPIAGREAGHTHWGLIKSGPFLLPFVVCLVIV